MILAQALPPQPAQTKFLLKNYIGWKIGLNFVTGAWRMVRGSLQWGIQCTCGSPQRFKPAADVVNGKVTQCNRCATFGKGKKRSRGSDCSNWKGTQDIPHTFFTTILKSAKARARDIPVEITIEDLQILWVKQDGLCAYTGTPLYFPSREKCGTASVDRIDSSKGYTIDNIQFVHKDVNLMKQALTEDRFLELCKMIAKHNA